MYMPVCFLEFLSCFHCQTDGPIQLKFSMWYPEYRGGDHINHVGVEMGVVFHSHKHRK